MRDHEIELISALIEGRLRDEGEARALIASSPELQAEYEAQKTAFEALTSAGAASMREDERAAIRRDVWTALRAEPAPSARGRWFYRMIPVGVGVFVVAVAALTVLNGGSGDSGGEALEVAGDSAEPTVATARELEESAATTEAAASDLTEQMTAAPETAGFAATARALRDGADGAFEAPTSTESASELDVCLAKAGLQDVEIIAIIDSAFIAETSGITVPADEDARTFAVAAAGQDDIESASIFFVDLDSCQVAYSDR